MIIIQSRLDGIPGNIVDPDAVQFASRKVAAVSGDARRALDICRRAVELAETGTDGVASVNGNRSSKKQSNVTIATIMRAINEATSNPIQQHIRDLPVMSKAILIAVMQRLRRSGLVETTVGDVIDEVKHNCGTTRDGRCMFGDSSIDIPGTERDRSGGIGIFDIRSALLDLASAGIVTLESHQTDRPNKVRLAVGTDEILMALKDDAEVRELGINIPV